MMNLRFNAFILVSIMLLAPLAGCFGEDEADVAGADALVLVEADSLQGGMWQTITLQASSDIAVFIPTSFKTQVLRELKTVQPSTLLRAHRKVSTFSSPLETPMLFSSSENTAVKIGLFEQPMNPGWIGWWMAGWVILVGL